MASSPREKLERIHSQLYRLAEEAKDFRCLPGSGASVVIPVSFVLAMKYLVDQLDRIQKQMEGAGR